MAFWPSFCRFLIWLLIVANLPPFKSYFIEKKLFIYLIIINLHILLILYVVLIAIFTSLGNKSPSFYTVKEECEFSVKISELVKGAWVPYQAKDVQFEFVRIDPFVRSTMTADKGGVFRTKFVIPDVYGVFKFVIKYSR